MIEILFFIFVGCFFGVATGLVPGIHANTVALVAVSLFGEFGLGVAVMIVAMSTVQSFVDFIPSVFLGAGEESTFLSVLPGHKLLLKGEGVSAIKFTIIGGVFGGVVAVLISPVYFLFIEEWGKIIYQFVPFILILILLFMVFWQKKQNKILWSFAIVALSSVIGLISLNFLAIGNPIFPLVTGFFGLSTLLNSLRVKTRLRKQLVKKDSYPLNPVLKYSLLSTLAGGFVSILPGVGASQAAFMAGKLKGKMSSKGYLVMLGGINTTNIIFSFFILFLLGKTRTGAAVAVKELVKLDWNTLLIFIAVILIAIGVGAIAAEVMAIIVAKNLSRFDYSLINKIIIILLFFLVYWFSGVVGILLLVVSAAVGLLTICTGTKRTNCMAFLMVPVIVFYLGI
ncbi:MAG: tripartite tricarboxylate transporter permease [Candidatus Diapherotrites archaeon]